MSSPQKPLNHNEKPSDERRSWAENVFKYMITGCLGGSVVGCGKGIIEGNLEAAKARGTMKLGVKKILGRSLRTGGRFAGNAVFLGIVFASMESRMVEVRDKITDDVMKSAVAGVAGFGTGVLYKVLEQAAPRSVAVAGAIGGIAGLAANRWNQDIERYMPIKTTIDGWEKKRWKLFIK